MKWVARVSWVVFVVAAVFVLGSGLSSSKAPTSAPPQDRVVAAVVDSATVTNAPTAKPASESPLPAPVAPAREAPAALERSEKLLMEALRELGSSDPTLSLQLARQGNARYPHSADAPERDWYAIRALVDSGNLLEAVAAARVFVQSFPENRFADDVARHLLTHPLTHPTEVGYAQ